MAIMRKVVLSALIVGFISGILLTLVQSLQINTIIFQAEQYEATNETLSHNSSNGQHQHNSAAWQPNGSKERTFYTFVSNAFAATGFALLLISVMSMIDQNLNWLKGCAWGLAGFVTFFLAPSIGLPPEIPGTVSVKLLDRQLWWLLAVMGTGSGIAVLVFAPGLYKAAGLALVILPHLVGAPGMEEILSFTNDDPVVVQKLQVLTEDFYPATALANAIYWLCIGIGSSTLVKSFVFRKPNPKVTY